jgi:hypothetical protein
VLASRPKERQGNNRVDESIASVIFFIFNLLHR